MRCIQHITLQITVLMQLTVHKQTQTEKRATRNLETPHGLGAMRHSTYNIIFRFVEHASLTYDMTGACVG